MSFQEILFGGDKDEAWRRFAQEISGTYEDGRRRGRVVVLSDVWTITLDTYTVSTGHAHITFTRLRAPFVTIDGFRFTIRRRGPFSGLGKLLGMQDLEIGDPEFDRAIVVTSNHPTKVRDLFIDPRLRERVLAQPGIRIDIKNHEGWFGPRFSESEDELRLIVRGVVTDIDRLKALHEIVAATLRQLSHMGSTSRIAPSVQL